MTTQSTTKRRRTTLQDGNRTSEEPHLVKKTKLLSCTECKVSFHPRSDHPRIHFCSRFLFPLDTAEKDQGESTVSLLQHDYEEPDRRVLRVLSVTAK